MKIPLNKHGTKKKLVLLLCQSPNCKNNSVVRLQNTLYCEICIYKHLVFAKFKKGFRRLI